MYGVRRGFEVSDGHSIRRRVLKQEMDVNEEGDGFWKKTSALKREVCEKETTTYCAEQEDGACVLEDYFAGDRK